MILSQFLSRLAAAKGGTATIILDLGEGLPSIPCRDEDQAQLIESLWNGFHANACLIDARFEQVEADPAASYENDTVTVKNPHEPVTNLDKEP